MTALILVVEDDESIRTLIGEALRSEGYLVTEAGHGLEALSLLSQVSPSGLIVDLNMPVMDGPTLLREIRSRGMALPCVVATAEEQASELLEGLSIDALIAKPFDLNQLLTTVTEICGPPHLSSG